MDILRALSGVVFGMISVSVVVGITLSIAWTMLYAGTYISNRLSFRFPNPIELAECHSAENLYNRQSACERIERAANGR